MPGDELFLGGHAQGHQHQIRLQGLDGLHAVGGDFLQLVQSGLGAALAGAGQLGLAAQGQDDVRQAGGKHHHAGGPGGDGHAVYLHGEHTGGRHPNKTQRAKAKTRRMALPIRIIFKALPFQAKPAKPTGPPTVHGESILFYPEWLCCVNSPGKALDFFLIPDYNKNLSGNWSEAPANAAAWTALPTRGAVYCVKYIT